MKMFQNMPRNVWKHLTIMVRGGKVKERKIMVIGAKHTQNNKAMPERKLDCGKNRIISRPPPNINNSWLIKRCFAT